MGLVRLLMFEDSERQLHPFTHSGPQGGHLGFAPSKQALIQRANRGVVAGSDHGGHVQRRSDSRCPRFRQARTAMEAAT